MATDPVMEPATDNLGQIGASTKRLVQRLLTIGENRLALLTVEVQEERERLLHAFLLALGVAAFGLLAGITLTTAIVVWLWAYSTAVVIEVPLENAIWRRAVRSANQTKITP